MGGNLFHLLYIVFSDRFYIFVWIRPFQKVHDYFKTENNIDNVFYLHKLRVADVGVLENEAGRRVKIQISDDKLKVTLTHMGPQSECI